jgi:phosphoribosylglycinamide formyltransferase 1
MKLGFLASHGGSNMQAIVDACTSGLLKAEVRVVISNNADSLALQRARDQHIRVAHLSSRTHPDPQELDAEIAGTLLRNEVDLVLLAGYMRKIGPVTLAQFPQRILNIHPALLPKYGGEGMYGRRVHEAVLASGDRTTGVTIHLVDEEYDRGPVVAQCEVEVLPGDSVETLAARVLEQEHKLYVNTLIKIAEGELDLASVVRLR